MKSSNKILLTVIISFFICTLLVAIIVRVTNGPKQSLDFAMTSNHVGKDLDRKYAVTDFSELEIDGSASVLIKNGQQPAVTITTPNVFTDDVAVNLIGSKLVIDINDRVEKRFSKKVMVVITNNAPLNKITTNGAASLNYEGITADGLAFEVNGASHCYLSGNVNSLAIEISGAGHVDAKNLIAQNVVLDVSGAADVSVYAKKYLKINAAGVAHINYYGNPQNIERDVAGMASINNKN